MKDNSSHPRLEDGGSAGQTSSGADRDGSAGLAVRRIRADCDRFCLIENRAPVFHAGVLPARLEVLGDSETHRLAPRTRCRIYLLEYLPAKQSADSGIILGKALRRAAVEVVIERDRPLEVIPQATTLHPFPRLWRAGSSRLRYRPTLSGLQALEIRSQACRAF